ncbi:hypothetical protein [Bradyrhizobium manausense]|uniref:hypothetical protein n=1 Tax=Bradyrhizobium manausense TaxID=989370 RepID=UPI0020132A76|nr:hypothetical protein [Bradyrhizobium manausense]
MRVGRLRGRNCSGNFKHDRRNFHQLSRTECPIMVKAPAFLLLSLALAGCAVAPQAHLASDPAFRPARYAWDGAGEDPNRPHTAAQPSRAARTVDASERAKSQAGLQPYSKEWWQAQDGIEAEQDAKVNRSLVICQGCLRPKQPPEDSRLAKAVD